jgi:hypothetical protein
MGLVPKLKKYPGLDHPPSIGNPPSNSPRSNTAWTSAPRPKS